VFGTFAAGVGVALCHDYGSAFMADQNQIKYWGMAASFSFVCGQVRDLLDFLT
jgi:hypothetical protein